MYPLFSCQAESNSAMANTMAPTRMRRETLSDQVREYLVQRIAQGGLEAGDLAPSEVEICNQLGVSRPTVREAYRSLAGLSILKMDGGKWRVRGLSHAVLAEPLTLALQMSSIHTHEVLELRRPIEIYAAQLAARNATQE